MNTRKENFTARCLVVLLSVFLLPACGNDETGVKTTKQFYELIDQGNIEAAAALRSSAQPYLQQGKTHVIASAGFSRAIKDCGGLDETKITPSTVSSRRLIEVDLTTKFPTRPGCAAAKHSFQVLEENGKVVLLSLPSTAPPTASAAAAAAPARQPLILKFENPTTSGFAAQPLKN